MKKRFGTTILILVVILCLGNYNLISANTEQEFNEILQKARSYKYKDPDSLIFFTNQALKVAYRNGNPNQKLDALLILVDSYIRSGETLLALSLGDSLKNISENENLIHRKADILIYLGNLYSSIGFSAEALEYFFQALDNSNQKLSIINKIDIYYYIAILYFSLNEIEQSRKYLNLSLKVALENNLYKQTLPCYMLYSNTFNRADSTQKYITLAEQVLDKYPKLNYERMVIYSAKALLNNSLGNYKDSKSQYLAAIDISKSSGFQGHQANLYNNYAYLLMEESKYDSAKYYLDLALVITIDIVDIDMESEVYDSYSDYYKAVGDTSNALKYTDLFISKRDEYREQQQIQKSLILSAVFETEQKEREILQQENKIVQLWIYMLSIVVFFVITIGLVVYFRQKYSISRSKMDSINKQRSLEIADAMIHGQDAERKRLAMDLHDGLAAKLGALGIMFDGFFTSHEKYEEVSISITNIHQYVRDLSHRMLPTQIDKLGLIQSIKNLVSYIDYSEKFNVEFETNIENRLTNKLEVNLFFLVHELINNSVRHSKGNNIFVQLLEYDNSINLSVEDNGVGFNYTEDTTGMGLKNIKTRIEYLGGNFKAESNKSVTLIMIEIPIPK